MSRMRQPVPYASLKDSPRPEDSTVMALTMHVTGRRLHHGQRDRGGARLIDHVRRVAARVPRHARVAAWLHETLEHSSISEEELLRTASRSRSCARSGC